MTHTSKVSLIKRTFVAEPYGLGAPIYGSDRTDLHYRAGRLFGRNGYRLREVDGTPGSALEAYALTLPAVELWDGPMGILTGSALVRVV